MISVIIPSYNRSNKIVDSVESVLNQTYTDIELIVIDDGSTDNTKEILEDIHDPRLKYVFQQNAGACAARNRGIGVAQGEYIAFQDSDDRWYPNKLEVQLKRMVEVDADVSFCKLSRTDTEEIAVHPNCKEGFITLRDMPSGISTQTLLMKRNVAENIMFDIDMPRFQDLEWVLRAIQKYSVYCVDEVLVDYAIAEDSISSSYEKLYSAVMLIQEKHPDLRQTSPLVWTVLMGKLVDAGSKMYANNIKDYRKYLLQGYKYGYSFFGKIKYLIVKCNLYPFFRRIKKPK